jgi:hypothetical protein
MDVLDSFDRWKEFLGTNVDRAQSLGMSDDQIANVATKVGEYLANKVDPKNDQERLLKQLWDVGSDDERKTVARLMVKLADQAH